MTSLNKTCDIEWINEQDDLSWASKFSSKRECNLRLSEKKRALKIKFLFIEQVVSILNENDFNVIQAYFPCHIRVKKIAEDLVTFINKSKVSAFM